MNQNMQDCTLIGIDTAKSSFAINGADTSGRSMLRQTLRPKRSAAVSGEVAPVHGGFWEPRRIAPLASRDPGRSE